RWRLCRLTDTAYPLRVLRRRTPRPLAAAARSAFSVKRRGGYRRRFPWEPPPYLGGTTSPLEGLQVQDPGLDLLGLAHVPVVFTQVSAGAAGDIHLVLVLVVAHGALPLEVVVDHDLPVVAAALAVVA